MQRLLLHPTVHLWHLTSHVIVSDLACVACVACTLDSRRFVFPDLLPCFARS